MSNCRQRSSSLAMQFQSIQGRSSFTSHQAQLEKHEQKKEKIMGTSPSMPSYVANQPTTIGGDLPTNVAQSSSSRLYVAESQPEQNQGTTTAMPTLNPDGYRDDIAVAKSYIDTINALVKQKNATIQNGDGIQPQNTYQNLNHIYQNTNINTNHLAPDSTISSNVPLCQPVTEPLNGLQEQNISENPVGALSGKKCRIEGCTAQSISRRPYCSRHSGNRLCEYKHGCTKFAQGATRFCIAHGGGRRCTAPGCDKGARDKFFCAAHGGGKRCNVEGCNKSAVGGSKLCTSHGGGRRCSVDGCEKSAQSSTKFCVKHGGGKKCAIEGCGKVARGRTLYCAGHGGGVRCKLEGCNRIAIGKLQLCRAHGGGSSRTKTKSAKAAKIPQQTAVQQPVMHHQNPTGSITQTSMQSPFL